MIAWYIEHKAPKGSTYLEVEVEGKTYTTGALVKLAEAARDFAATYTPTKPKVTATVRDRMTGKSLTFIIKKGTHEMRNLRK